MGKKVITGVGLVAGPYSPAVVAGGLCFVSGQIGFDSGSGGLVKGGIAEEFRQAIKNLEAILTAADCSIEDVVTTTLYLTDLSQFGEVNSAFSEAFGSEPPARATIEVAALPLGASIEISAVAVSRNS